MMNDNNPKELNVVPFPCIHDLIKTGYEKAVNKESPKTKQQYLDTAKGILLPEDYELFLCAIMDSEFIEKNPEETWLPGAVENYFECP